MSKHWFATVLVMAFGFWAMATRAQVVEGESLEDPATEARAFDIAKRTMSPFCPGRTLADCPSGNATQWRQDIRAFLKQGKSAAEIQQILNARAGENLSGAPESSLGWVLPVALCAGALAVLTLVLRRIRREDTTTSVRDHEVRAGSASEASEDSGEEGDETELEPASEVPATTPPRDEQELEERLRRELAEHDEA